MIVLRYWDLQSYFYIIYIYLYLYLQHTLSWYIQWPKQIVYHFSIIEYLKASQVALVVKNLPAMQEIQETMVWSLGWEDPLKQEMATHCSILARKCHGQRWLVGYSPWGHKESDTTEWTHTETDSYWYWYLKKTLKFQTLFYVFTVPSLLLCFSSCGSCLMATRW